MIFTIDHHNSILLHKIFHLISNLISDVNLQFKYDGLYIQANKCNTCITNIYFNYKFFTEYKYINDITIAIYSKSILHILEHLIKLNTIIEFKYCIDDLKLYISSTNNYTITYSLNTLYININNINIINHSSYSFRINHTEFNNLINECCKLEIDDIIFSIDKKNTKIICNGTIINAEIELNSLLTHLNFNNSTAIECIDNFKNTYKLQYFKYLTYINNNSDITISLDKDMPIFINIDFHNYYCNLECIIASQLLHHT